MEDYLTVLLNDLEDHASAFLPGGYYLALHRESAAAEALCATFTQEQQRCSTSLRTPATPVPLLIRRRWPGGPSSWPGKSIVKSPRRTAPRCCCR